MNIHLAASEQVSNATEAHHKSAVAMQTAQRPANDNGRAIVGLGQAADNTNSTMDRFANTITRRLIAAFVVKEIKDFIGYLWQLSAAVAATGQSADQAAICSQKFQGLQTAASYKGISNDAT